MGLVTARHGTNNNDYYSNGDEEERGRGSCDYHDDDEDDDEYQSLMMNKNFDNHDNNVGTAAVTTSRRKIRRCCHNKYHHRLVTLGLLVIMAIVASIIFAERHHHYLFNKQNNGSKKKRKRTKRTSLPVYYECPSDFVGPGRDSGSDGEAGGGTDTFSEYHERDYEEKANLISDDNITEYIKTFQDIQYDNWGYTYNEVKSKMYSFKSKYFSKIIKELQTENEEPISIYESASGIGLNLYMTLEILNELDLLEDDNEVFVYGNEYLQINAQIYTHPLSYL